jgi:hypothetical protein
MSKPKLIIKAFDKGVVMSKPKLIIKAFDKDYNRIPYAIYEDDFTVEIPEDCTLIKLVQKNKKQAAHKRATKKRKQKI